MKDSYISYYELLTRIKERNIPQLLILHLVPNKSVEYISYYDYADSEFIGYEILKDEKADENYSYHLGDCFLESTMFDKVIEIIEEEKEIEKLDIGKLLQTKKWKRDKKTWNKINELIDEVNKLKEEK